MTIAVNEQIAITVIYTKCNIVIWKWNYRHVMSMSSAADI